MSLATGVMRDDKNDVELLNHSNYTKAKHFNVKRIERGIFMRAIILAGGKGTRLQPYTTILPKPLMPVNQQSIVEIVIRQLKHHGFNHITLALGHLAHLVKAVLGNGNHLDVKIDYSLERVPLGTSGPLSLIPDLDDTFLVMNGDILSDLDFKDMLQFHRERQAVATIAVHRRKVHIDYGVLHRKEYRLLKYEEKPTIDYEVSTGIYIFQREVINYIHPGAYLDFPELVKMLMHDERPVMCYPFDGIWFDLGRVEDFQYVQERIDALEESIPFLSPNGNHDVTRDYHVHTSTCREEQRYEA